MLADERRGTGAREGVGSLRPAAGHRTHVNPSPNGVPVDAELAADLLLADLPVAALDELHDGDLPVRGPRRGPSRRTRPSSCPCRCRC